MRSMASRSRSRRSHPSGRFGIPPAAPRSAPVTAAFKGDQFLRLRIDGVDSLLVDYQHTPLQFDPNQKVTVT